MLYQSILDNSLSDTSSFLFEIMPFQGYYTSKEVTELLRIDPFTLRRWVKKGRIERIRVGNMSFYEIKQIDKIVNNVDKV